MSVRPSRNKNRSIGGPLQTNLMAHAYDGR
jgi:hypothetical protein